MKNVRYDTSGKTYEQWKRDVPKLSLQTTSIQKRNRLKDTLVPPLWGTREENACFSRIICSRCCTGRNLRFHVENSNTLIINSSRDDRPSISTWKQPTANPLVARGVQRSSPKPEKRPIFCQRRGIDNFCRLLSTQQRLNVFVSLPR